LRLIVEPEVRDLLEAWLVEISERVLAGYREAAKAAAPPDIGITQWAEANRFLGHSSRLNGP
jgi:hypothetical protein